ncbi:MAG TPA: response regulator [Alphaproteobacteria bacterium]
MPNASLAQIQEMGTVQPCQVLLLEDDRDDQIFARRELMASDVVKEVVCFSDGDKLAAYMRDAGFMDRTVMALTPILILVDLEMPKKDGLMVIEDLKSDQFLKDIPIIVVTGTMDGDKLGQAKKLGANGVFRKPLRHSVLTDYYRSAWKWPQDDMWFQ